MVRYMIGIGKGMQKVALAPSQKCAEAEPDPKTWAPPRKRRR